MGAVLLDVFLFMNNFLKDYHIINNLPEGSFDHMNQNARQLRAFSEWFFENMDQRLAELQRAYHAFSGKYLDYSPESLKGLGEFFLYAIDTEKLTPEEFDIERAKYPDYIPIDDYTLTNRSLSLIVDVGIYIGEVMIRNHKNMIWGQKITKNKRDIERGYMVIIINSNKYSPYLNPIGFIRTMGWKVARKAFSINGIYDIYDYYCGRVAPEYMLES